MGLSARMCVLGLALFASTAAAAGAGAFQRPAATAGKILRATPTGEASFEGMLAIAVSGLLPPNSEALIVPKIDDGRITYVASDLAAKVRSSSSGFFADVIEVPDGAKSVELMLTTLRGRLLDTEWVALAGGGARPDPLVALPQSQRRRAH